ncbi:MAG TPA: flavin reductase family protein [bacterium]|nr:flavin reductase family protein [bacterium]
MDTTGGIDARVFRDALAHFATGITIVTAPAVDGPHGVTINAFTSLSLRPPLVLICIEHGRYSLQVLETARVFAVNVLAEGQEHLSRFFSTDSRPEGPHAFDGIPYRPGRLGAPVLDGCLALLECRVTAQYPGGDHAIFVGEVEAAEVFPGRRPLLYYDRAYCGLAGT